MASSGVVVSTAAVANEAPEIPDNVGDWLRGVYRFFPTSAFAFMMPPIVLSSDCRQMESCAPTICDHHKICPDGS
uniref:Uncharacterized protein n=1 Tax=Microcebus murinus TaxID=30608 RepID=A0A8C5YBA9_MICMU